MPLEQEMTVYLYCRVFVRSPIAKNASENCEAGALQGKQIVAFNVVDHHCHNQPDTA